MSDDQTLTRPRPDELAFVCWRGGDGAQVSSCPIERKHAEALARAYADFFPGRTYWVEPVPWLDPPARARGRA